MAEIIDITVKFDNEYEITITPNLNKILHLITIPKTAETIIFNHTFDREINPGFIPSGVKKIIFGTDFNKKLKLGVIPVGVEIIEFGNLFDQKLELGDIPNGVKKIKFGRYFNQKLVPGVIPMGIEVIEFGCYFNQKLVPGIIPVGVRKIQFGYNFNQKLELGDIPIGVRKIEFGANFDQELVPGVIPSDVLSLIFGRNYNQPIKKDVLPINLKKIFFNTQCYGFPLPSDVIPNSVSFFQFYLCSNTKEIPDRVTKLVIVTDKTDVLIPDTIKNILLSQQILDKIFFKLCSRNILDAKYTLMHDKKNMNKPKNVSGKYYLTHEGDDDSTGYYTITFEQQEEEIITKLKKEIDEKNQLELQLQLELKNIKDERDKLRDELTKNNKLYEKTQKIIKLFQTNDLFE